MSPKCPAGIASGSAGVSALRMTSRVVLVVRAHQPHAAGTVALTIVPGLTTTWRGRKCPSFDGFAPRAAPKPVPGDVASPSRGSLIDPRVWSANPEKSMVISSPATSMTTGSAMCSPSAMPSSSRKASAR